MNIPKLPEKSVNGLQKVDGKVDNDKPIPCYYIDFPDLSYIINVNGCGSVRRRYITAIHSDWSSDISSFPSF